MKIEEYLSTLPQSILSGEEIQIPPDTIREICKFADLGQDDTFYHLGSGNGTSLKIARQEFNVKNAIGIDNSKKMISLAKKMIDDVAEIFSDRLTVKQGIFAALMEVSLINDGPLTMFIESRDGKIQS